MICTTCLQPHCYRYPPITHERRTFISIRQSHQSKQSSIRLFATSVITTDVVKREFASLRRSDTPEWPRPM